MQQDVRMTTAVVKVIAAMLEQPELERYGLDLMRGTGLPSGTLYPILVRLERAGWLDPSWEDIDPVAEGRPARRYYRLTPLGVTEGRRELAALRQLLAKAPGAVGKARPA